MPLNSHSTMLTWYNIAWCNVSLKSNRVFALQKKAVRIITCSKYNDHTEPLFKTLKLLKFKDLLKLRELIFYYTFIHKLLPIPLQNWHITRNTNIHEHNTRRQSNLHIYRTQHTFARHCLRHDLPNTLNNTCELVKGKIYTHSLSGFTNYAKHQIILNYELTCRILQDVTSVVTTSLDAHNVNINVLCLKCIHMIFFYYINIAYNIVCYI